MRWSSGGRSRGGRRQGSGEGGGREQRREEQGRVDLTLGLGVTTAGGEEAALEAWAAGRKLPGEEAASRAVGGWRNETGTRQRHGRRAAGGAR